MSDAIQPADLGFFSTLVHSGSLTAAGRELGLTTAAVSKRLAQIEARLGARLVTRTTRRMGLTPEGDLYLEHARRILADLAAMEQQLTDLQGEPQGLLRVNATLGFGRRHIAPLVSAFVQRYPRVDVQLQLTVDPPPLADNLFDLCFRFGRPPDSRGIARRIASNQRVLVAAPAYLKRAGMPKAPRDLLRHACIVLRQGDDAYGQWRFTPERAARRDGADDPSTQSLKIRGHLTTNDGSVAVQWALDGHGILLRAAWDVAPYLASGQLVQLLQDHRSPEADIYAVYPEQHRGSVRVRALVDFVLADFGAAAAGDLASPAATIAGKPQ